MSPTNTFLGAAANRSKNSLNFQIRLFPSLTFVELKLCDELERNDLNDDLLSCELVAPSYTQTRSFSPSFHGIRQNTRQRRNAQSEVLFTPRLLADYRVSVFKTTKKLLFKPFYKCFVIPHGFMNLVTYSVRWVSPHII